MRVHQTAKQWQQVGRRSWLNVSSGSREMDLGVSSLPPFSSSWDGAPPLIFRVGLPSAVLPLQKCPHRHTQRSTVQGNLNHIKVTVRITHCTGQALYHWVTTRLWLQTSGSVPWIQSDGTQSFGPGFSSLNMVFAEFICVVAGLLLLLLFVVGWKNHKYGHAIFSHPFHQLVHIFSVSKQTLLGRFGHKYLCARTI